MMALCRTSALLAAFDCGISTYWEHRENPYLCLLIQDRSEMLWFVVSRKGSAFDFFFFFCYFRKFNELAMIRGFLYDLKQNT